MVFLLHYQQSSKQCIFSLRTVHIEILMSLFFSPISLCFNALLPLERICHKIWQDSEVEICCWNRQHTYMKRASLEKVNAWFKKFNLSKLLLLLPLLLEILLSNWNCHVLTVIDNLCDFLKLNWTTTFR